MTKDELFIELKQRFFKLVEEHNLMEEGIHVACKALSPIEAIGITERKDFPILVGKEVMMQASFRNGIGQSFTSTPALWTGSIKELFELDILNNDYDRNIFIASLNAVMRDLGLCERSIHCKDQGPEDCACHMVEELKRRYPEGTKITQIGYQPAILDHVSKHFPMKILDLNPDHVGKERFGVLVQDGIKDYKEAVDWADLVLCTGSTLGNGSIVDFIDLDKDVLFYGTSAAGAAALMGWKRICFAL